MATMQGLTLPGNSTVRFGDYPVPDPGPGQVLMRVNEAYRAKKR